MRGLRWWMRIVGVFYLLLAIRLLPVINAGQFAAGLRNFTASPNSTEFKAIVDWMFTFGLDLGVVGALLLIAARDPLKNLILVQLVIAQEALRGVVADLWFISRGWVVTSFYVGFIIVHLLIIGTGLAVYPRRAAARPPAATVP